MSATSQPSQIELVSPVGKGTLEAFADDKATMQRLWERSRKETGVDWKL